MRKILLAVVLFTSFAMNAQFWIGGSLGLEFVKPDYEGSKTITTFSFAPELGFAGNEKVDFVLALNESLINYDGTTANSISVEPYIRYTFAKAGIVSLFIDGGFGVGYTEFSDYDFLEESQIRFHIGFRPGIKLSLTEKFGLSAKLGFVGYEKIVSSYDAFGFNLNNNSLSFGAYYSF